MTDQDSTADRKPETDAGAISFWTVLVSTLAAAIGVQSKANKERDFASGRVAPFIVAGIVFTVLFILTLVTVVRLVLGGAG